MSTLLFSLFNNIVRLHCFCCSGQSALHLCATLTGEKVPPRSSPAEVCDLLLRREAGRLSDKEFGAFVDSRDADGNTGKTIKFSEKIVDQITYR